MSNYKTYTDAIIAQSYNKKIAKNDSGKIYVCQLRLPKYEQII